ncbi:MAG: hypothetical protein M1376_15570 [Planctomycetes bacterium]|nr:hypothetical protein [Planctomycetota bacterium]
MDPGAVLGVLWFISLIALAFWTRDAEVIEVIVAASVLLTMGIIASRQRGRPLPSRRRQTKKPAVIDAEAVQKWSAEIVKYDQQPRPHHECYDPVRAILVARKETSESIRKTTTPPSNPPGER